MSSVVKENYLKALFFLNEKDKSITLTDLGKVMGVSKPTVNGMVKKLQEKGWLKYEKYKPLKITKEGSKAAALVIRKHRLSEMFLTEVMGFGWEEVHEIAEELEHINSEKLFDRMNEIMGFPTVDPHGSPIPDKNGRITKINYVPLSEVTGKSNVIFRAIRDSSNDLLHFLNRKKLSLGSEITVEDFEPYDQSVTISYADFSKVQLGPGVTVHLLVEIVIPHSKK